MKNLLALYGLFLVFASVSFDVRAELEHPYTVISAEELVELQKNDANLVIIDSRGKDYVDGKVIKGAVHLSAKETDQATLAKVIPSKDTAVVFYCNNTACPASAIAGHKADSAGYTNTYKYPGGMEDWLEKGLPTDSI